MKKILLLLLLPMLLLAQNSYIVVEAQFDDNAVQDFSQFVIAGPGWVILSHMEFC